MTSWSDKLTDVGLDRPTPSVPGRDDLDPGGQEAGPGSGNPPGHAMSPSRFLAKLGRELWEPMSNMTSMTGFLLETELSRDQHEMVAELRSSGEKLLRLIRDALDAVEVEAGLVQAALIPFDLRVLTDETVSVLRGWAFKKGRSIECRAHHEVPSRLMGDPGRLRQVLWNLCKHAIEANAAGGVMLRVARLHEDSRSVTLRFEVRFYGVTLMGRSVGGDGPGGRERSDALPVVTSGNTGLQLEIARRLVGVMGSQVVVEEEPGHAPHAWFNLTLEKQKEAPSEEVAAPPRTSLVGQRVLVVDPTEAIRHALAAKLAQWGCRVEEATQAEDAMAMVTGAATANDPFRFVLIERDLPVMSAHKFGAHLRARSAGEPLHLVMFAAVGQRGDLEDAHACGFDAYLPKPIDWQDLVDALVEIEHMAITGPSGEERRLVTRHWLAETRRSRTRVLIVEDDVVSVLVTDWTLRRIGYQVVRANSASEMRRLLAGDGAPFDLVVLALRLPDADGLSLPREIRAATPEGRATAIVALGYECTRAERDRCRAEGIDAFVARPVDLGHLCEVVEQLTRTSLPTGPEVKDLLPNGNNLPASGRKSADRDRIEFRFEVDTNTGAVLSDGQAVKAAMSVPNLEAALAASMDLMAPETSGDVAAGANPVPHRPERQTAAMPAPRVADEPGPPLDLVRLDAVSMNNPALRNGLLAAYLREARVALDLVGQAVAAGDIAAVVSQSHRLSQRSEAVGAIACREILSELESLGREGLVAGAESLVARASTELSRVERVASVLGVEASAPA